MSSLLLLPALENAFVVVFLLGLISYCSLSKIMASGRVSAPLCPFYFPKAMIQGIT